MSSDCEECGRHTRKSAWWLDELCRRIAFCEGFPELGVLAGVAGAANRVKISSSSLPLRNRSDLGGLSDADGGIGEFARKHWPTKIE